MFDRLTPTNKALILANVGVFVLWLLLGNSLVSFALWPPQSGVFRPWQLLTYGFLHVGWLQLFFNMFALFLFGSEVERLYGARRYLVYYVACIVGGALMCVIIVTAAKLPPSPAIGASGAVFGLLLSYGMAYPRREIIIFPIPVPIQAWIAVALYAVAELYLGISSIGGVSPFTSLGGMATGFVMIRYWQAKQNRPRR
jgi:membrane associated rhomboid family serine protease